MVRDAGRASSRSVVRTGCVLDVDVMLEAFWVRVWLAVVVVVVRNWDRAGSRSFRPGCGAVKDLDYSRPGPRALRLRVIDRLHPHFDSGFWICAIGERR